MLMASPTPPDFADLDAAQAWNECRFLTCSVLPVRMACNLHCPFCFSKSSVSALKFDSQAWSQIELEQYYGFARERGATRLVITGGGEPLLRPDSVVQLVERGSKYFAEIACFTNGARLTRDLSQRLADAGLSYVCYSRHHNDDGRCRQLMGADAPALDSFVTAASPLKIRATCVMTQGWIDSPAGVAAYIAALSARGIREFTFKHTYVAYRESLFAESSANAWSRAHHVDFDPFAGQGEIVSRLPWGPCIRQIELGRVCYYFEPTPQWELEHRLCRSINLLSDGSIYASLEDQRSRLFPQPH